MEVFSVKVEEDLKARIKSLISESGKEGNDFMEQIVKLYELNMAKDIMPSAMGDVEELQAVTKRIYDIFVGLIERSSNLMKDKEGVLREEIEKKNRAISLIQGQLDKTLEELESFRTENQNLNVKYQELKNDISVFETRMQEQDKNNKELLRSKEELITEYKEKNDTLNGIISEYQSYKDKNNVLAASIEKMKNEMEQVEKKVQEKEKSEDKLKNQMEQLKSQNEVAISKVQMEKEKALLELREKHQSKLEELSNEHNSRVEEYNAKVKVLIDEIESMRKGEVKSEKVSKKK